MTAQFDHCVDAAPELIEYASRKAHSLPNCRFQTGAAESLAFPDACCDVLVSSLIVHHIPDELRLQAVLEMRRALRQDGPVQMADLTTPQKGRWRLIGSITGHNAMQRRMSPPEPRSSKIPYQGSRHE